MSTELEKYDAKLSVRIRSEDLLTFKNHCRTKLLRGYQDVVREMIAAVNDGRFKIIPTEDQQTTMKELYDEH